MEVEFGGEERLGEGVIVEGREFVGVKRLKGKGKGVRSYRVGEIREVEGRGMGEGEGEEGEKEEEGMEEDEREEEEGEMKVF